MGSGTGTPCSTCAGGCAAFPEYDTTFSEDFQAYSDGDYLGPGGSIEILDQVAYAKDYGGGAIGVEAIGTGGGGTKPWRDAFRYFNFDPDQSPTITFEAAIGDYGTTSANYCRFVIGPNQDSGVAAFGFAWIHVESSGFYTPGVEGETTGTPALFTPTAGDVFKIVIDQVSKVSDINGKIQIAYRARFYLNAALVATKSGVSNLLGGYSRAAFCQSRYGTWIARSVANLVITDDWAFSIV